MSGTEQWQPGDVVLAADGCIWWRGHEGIVDVDWPWTAADGQQYQESELARPLTLLVRDGKPVTDRTCTHCGSGSEGEPR